MVKKQLILTTVIFILSALLLCGCSRRVDIDATTTVTRTGTVIDQAMASPTGSYKIWEESYPYFSVEFEDTTGICVWNKINVDTSHIEIGDTVEITYGLQKSTGHWILINIKEVN